MELASVLWPLSLYFNARSVAKFLIDWHGFRATRNFVETAYGGRADWPSVGELARDPQAPYFLLVVAAFEEPEIVRTLRALLAVHYREDRIRVAVITKAEEDRLPRPEMQASTAELVRRFRASLPASQRNRLFHLVLPGPGRKADQLNWALRPEFLQEAFGRSLDPRRLFVGVSDADSYPDPDLCRWVAHRLRESRDSAAFQGVPLALGNFDRLPTRGRICAIQQSGIFIRVCIARLLNEGRRVELSARLARTPAVGRWLASAFDFSMRRSHICLGHNQLTRFDVLSEIGGYPPAGTTEDSTLGYALGARGLLLEPAPLLELVDLPETPEQVMRQNARWYLGAVDDAGFLWRAWREHPTAYNFAQFLRHLLNRVIEWPAALLVFPAVGYLGWRLAWDYPHEPWSFYAGIGLPLLSIALTLWVGGVVTTAAIARFEPLLPVQTDLRPRGFVERVLRVIRCQTYWVLSTRGTWKVLWAALRGTRYQAAKTDRTGKRPAESAKIRFQGVAE